MEVETRFHISFDSVIMILLALISLELNIPFVLDQLEFHKAMPLMGALSYILCPGGSGNPLVVLQNQFAPLKLLIRTLTLAIVFLFLASNILGLKYRFRSVLTGILVLIHVVIPMSLMIRARLAVDNHALAHDGGTIQIEESMKMVLSSRNPYTETFHGTPLENWRGFSNNVIYHVPYMPGAFLFSIPVYLLMDSITGWYDQRILHLLLFLASLYLITHLVSPGEKRIVAWLVLALNPFFTRYFLLGTNDVVVIFFLLLTMTMERKKLYRMGFLALAAACCIKQFAWFFVPFLSILLLEIHPSKIRSLIQDVYLKRWRWLPGAFLIIACVTPFLVWDWQNFYDDTVRYGSGGLPTSYPMQGFHGYGFATLLLFFRWVPNGSAQFPFIIIQLIFVIPWFFLLWRRFISDLRLEYAVFYSAMTLLPFMFLSRYLHGNFVGFILFWPILGWCMQAEKDSF